MVNAVVPIEIKKIASKPLKQKPSTVGQPSYSGTKEDENVDV